MWGGKTKMKKISITLLLVSVLSLFIVGCTSSKETALTDADNKNINTVYELSSKWDTPSQTGTTSDKYINKIKFFDFDGTGKISFFVSYDVNYILGAGYYILEDGTIERIEQEDVYDTDTHTRIMGCIGQTMSSGADWNQSFTDEEKFNVIKNAYIDYLKRSN